MEKKWTFPKTQSREFFRAYVEILRPFLRGLRGREADVFAELLYYNYKKRDIKNIEDRFKLILGTDTRKEIESHLNISAAVFRNALTKLRERGLLKENNIISDTYLISKKEEKVVLKFIFLLENQ